MSDIKVGDYIEGKEIWYNKPHKMRIVVSEIVQDENLEDIYYHGQADDPWKGARGGCIDAKAGPVRVITDEKPFMTKWWRKNKKLREKGKQTEMQGKQTETVWRRNWRPGDIVRHFKGDLYEILYTGVDTETEQEVIIYKRIDDTGNVCVRSRKIFESEVDKERYPEVKQTWRFESV